MINLFEPILFDSFVKVSECVQGFDPNQIAPMGTKTMMRFFWFFFHPFQTTHCLLGITSSYASNLVSRLTSLPPASKRLAFPQLGLEDVRGLTGLTTIHPE